MNCKASLLLCVVFWSPAAGAAAAESLPASYPDRPFRVVVPSSPGGGTDFFARLVMLPLAERLGQPAVIDNRPGAGSLIGTEIVANATPDGYTLLVMSSSFVINPSVYKKMPYDSRRDFAPVALLSQYPHLAVVHPSSPVKSMKELIAQAKAKPGTLNYASAGIGTPTHLGTALFASMAGINVVHVPYRGGGPAIIGILGRQVQFYIGPIVVLLSHVKAGRLKALAVTGAKRSSVLPDVPSVAEAGVPGFRQDAWNGLLAPAGTPPAIIRKLNSEMSAVLKMRAIHERLATQGVEPGGVSFEEFGAMLKNEMALWAKVVHEAGIKPE
ncbi:MAG: hypothetical protein A3G24_24965 [Betaproteobacteria bacterium RIFCSPLOWO2_12_FULL_62_13]|nr:MAG: hypothetical protein A3G24_24965 [Betaproteobacteria bacterium RIFCSPLOWO2_12_FULL_62_13]